MRFLQLSCPATEAEWDAASSGSAAPPAAPPPATGPQDPSTAVTQHSLETAGPGAPMAVSATAPANASDLQSTGDGDSGATPALLQPVGVPQLDPATTTPRAGYLHSASSSPGVSACPSPPLLIF